MRVRVTEVKLKVRKVTATVTSIKMGHFILMIPEVSSYCQVTFEKKKKISHVSLGIVDKMKT